MNKFVLIVLLLVFEIGSLVNIYLQYPNYTLSVIFFDIGQGDSTLIKTKNNTKILIDTGPDERIVEKMSAESKIIDKKIDYVILTHSDMDHVGGMVGLLENYDIKNIIFNFDVNIQSKYFIELKRLINEENSKVQNAFDTSDITIDGCNFDFVWPIKDSINNSSLSTNDSSISIKVSYQNFDLFLGGDISNKVENTIEKNIKEVEVMKIDHHGSASSTNQEFLSSLSPEYAIISVGKNNKYNHPSKLVLGYLEEDNIKYFRTDEDGDIECKVNTGEDYSCYKQLFL